MQFRKQISSAGFQQGQSLAMGKQGFNALEIHMKEFSLDKGPLCKLLTVALHFHNIGQTGH